MLVIGLIGGLMTFLAAEASRATDELRRNGERDAAALRISERVRSSTGLDEVIRHTVAELGETAGSMRCVVRLAPQAHGSMPAFQWQRPGLEPFDLPRPPDHVLSVFETGERLVVDDVEKADDAMRAFGDMIGARSIAVYPVVWRERVVATFGFADERPRRWDDDVTPLLDRLLPQLAAAIAQAELFDEQRAALERIEELTRLRETSSRTSRTSCERRSRRRSDSCGRSSATTSRSPRRSAVVFSRSPAPRRSGAPDSSTICSSSRAWVGRPSG